MSIKIQVRRDTASNWLSADPILSSGEIGLETDTLRFKYGDGTLKWSDLPYPSLGGGSVQSISAGDGLLGGIITSQGELSIDGNVTLDMLSEQAIKNKALKNTSQTFTTIFVDNGILNLDLSASNNFIVNFEEDIDNFTTSNNPENGMAFVITLVLNITTGSAVTWPSNVIWPDGVFPASSAVGTTDIFKLLTIDGGSSFYAYIVGQGYNSNSIPPNFLDEFLSPSDGKPGDGFGISAAISKDGRTAVVGSIYNQYSGAAYVFRRSEDRWLQIAKLLGEDNESAFGTSVAISEYGDVIAVGAPQEGTNDVGAAYIFTESNESWINNKIIPEDSADITAKNLVRLFGSSVSLSNDGTLLIVGAPDFDVPENQNTGAVYVFRSDGPPMPPPPPINNYYIYGTGKNTDCELGLGDKNNRAIFTLIKSASPLQIAVGKNYALYIKHDGTLWATGKTGLGLPVDPMNQSYRNFIQLGSDYWLDVKANNKGTTLLINADGSLWGCGYNQDGNLAGSRPGSPTRSTTRSPT